MGIFEIINAPLGFILRNIYNFIGSYGWSLIIFTIIVKGILFPLSIKQQKSMAGMQAIQPKLAEIQKKYKYDQEKLNAETMKLYQQHKISPMGGCLPLIIQFPILIGLYNIIRNPLTYIMEYSGDIINQIVEVLNNSLGLALQTGNGLNQITVADAMFKHADMLQAALPEISIKAINFNFWGLDLSAVPQLWPITPLIVIPILAALSTFMTSWITTKMNGTPSQPTEGGAGNAMKMMNYIFPFMTGFLSLSLPAGLGFYWILSNVLQLLQQVILTKHYSHKRELDDVKEPYRVREAKKKARNK